MIFPRIPHATLDERIEALLARPGVAALLLAVLVVAAHGYEIFGFHLTIDEELHASHASVAAAWLSQGRWGMALLSTLLPNSVTPAVSTSLGVGLLSTAVWLLLVRHIGLVPWTALIAAGVALTLPTLPFALTFTTLAYGLGAAALALYACARLLDGEHSRRRVVLASALGAFAIAVYQPMLVALAAILLFDGLRRLGERGWTHFALLVGAAMGAIVIYLVMDRLVRGVTGVELKYVESFLDLAGLLADPVGRITAASLRIRTTLALAEERFGLGSPWMGVFLIACLLLAWRPLADRAGVARYARPLAVVGLLALLVVADALPTNGAPVRSIVYLPVVLALIVATVGDGLRGWPRLALGALAGLSVLGGCILCNRLYASAELAWKRDFALAQSIIAQVERLRPFPTGNQPLRLEMAGAKQWPQSNLMPKRETLGASFFEWEGGNRFRVASLLTQTGLPTVGISNQERGPYARVARDMPVWPQEGSIRVVDGVLILKFSEYSLPQKRKLCEAGERDFC